MPICLARAIALLLATMTWAGAQLPPDDALARLKARQVRAAGSQPTTQPLASTRPTSLKDAHRIVFVLDPQLPAVSLRYLKEEICLAVDHLGEEQFFTIIVMAVQNQVPRTFSANPLRATTATKAAAKDFVNSIQDEHKTNPVPAIRKAVDLKPDLLYYVVEYTSIQSEMVRRAFDPLHGRLNILLFSGLEGYPNEFLRTLAIEHGGKAIDRRGNEIEPPAPKPSTIAPASRPSILEK